MSVTTSWTLITEAAKGNRASRDTFARLYGPVVRIEMAARCKRARDDAEVEDAVQEVLLECLRCGGALDQLDATKCTRFRAFLAGVTRNIAMRALRKRSRMPGTLDDADPPQDPGPDIDACIDSAWRQAVLGEALAQLLQESRRSELSSLRVRILRMRYEEGMAPAHIATVLGLTLQRVHRISHDAREDFRLALLDVVSRQNPAFTRAEAEAECIEVLGTGPDA